MSPWRPGLRRPDTTSMVRVDQAGEFGATRIYAGQLAVLRRNPSAAKLVSRMADQERRHLDRFNAVMADRRVRPTALQPVWNVAGFALGAATALISEEAAMACTAVHHDGMVTFNGTKTLITNALQSKYLLLMAKDPAVANPREAISMYLVPMDAPGLSTNRLEKIVWHISDSCEIFLDDVTLPESCLVGVKGAGFKQLMRNFEMERLVIASQCWGLAECAYEDAATYAAQTHRPMTRIISSINQLPTERRGRGGSGSAKG